MACIARAGTIGRACRHVPLARIAAHGPDRLRAAGGTAGLTPDASSLCLVSTVPQGTQLLAHYFASDLRPSDCYLLRGEVGSGKTFFW